LYVLLYGPFVPFDAVCLLFATLTTPQVGTTLTQQPARLHTLIHDTLAGNAYRPPPNMRRVPSIRRVFWPKPLFTLILIFPWTNSSPMRPRPLAMGTTDTTLRRSRGRRFSPVCSLTFPSLPWGFYLWSFHLHAIGLIDFWIISVLTLRDLPSLPSPLYYSTPLDILIPRIAVALENHLQAPAILDDTTPT